MVPITEMHRLSGIARSVIYEFLGGGRSKREVDGLRAELRAAGDERGEGGIPNAGVTAAGSPVVAGLLAFGLAACARLAVEQGEGDG